MNLTYHQRIKIVLTAHLYLGVERTRSFKCVDFVREVYLAASIRLPILSVDSPPKEFNIRKKDLNNLPLGELIFFKDPKDKRNRIWTHVAIATSHDECIHCSFFFGEKVVLTPISVMHERYTFAESAA